MMADLTHDLSLVAVIRADPAETRYGGAVDVKRAADLYAQGPTLRQIGAERDAAWTVVGHQRARTGVTMRGGGPSAIPLPGN
jgi:hypothetical protein